MPITITPELHATLLALATLVALLFAGIILARNPQSTPARMHAVYAGAAAWWFFCMAMVATARGPEGALVWSHLVHLAIGMLPAVMFHVNVSTARQAAKHRRRIRLHYALASVLTVAYVTWPGIFVEPHLYSWGYYPAYTVWGLLPVAFVAIAFVEVLLIYRRAMARHEPGTIPYDKARAFFHGNVFAMLGMIDFLPAFGFEIYPCGFAVGTALHVAETFGSIRYRLIEITPEFAADTVLDTMSDGLLVVDDEQIVRLTNRALGELVGRSPRTLVDRSLHEVIEPPELLRALSRAAPAVPASREVHFVDANGRERYVSVSGSLLQDHPRGGPIASVWVLHDCTDQRLAEGEKEELSSWIRETQKFETLGVMAGGIAHDFNNFLHIIVGNAEVARRRLDGTSPAEKSLGTILDAAEHASALTEQMLTYAGEGSTPMGPVDLSEVTREMSGLFASALPRKAKLTLELVDDLPTVRGSSSQLSQVIMNMISNAADALGDAAGTVSVRTGRLGARSVGGPPAMGTPVDGPHVFVEVADTGVGMDQFTRERVFEPFFTTKFKGRGLGMATVMGIVQAHGGHIRLSSEPGLGTRVLVALPVAEGVGAERTGNEEDNLLLPENGGMALLAEDEAEIRKLVGQALDDQGYGVLEAADGEQALRIFHERRRDISLVVLDVRMPSVDGREVFAEIRALAPALPVVFMSGYSAVDSEIAPRDAHTTFLRKPFRTTVLADRIRAARSGGGD